jgi:hypothetical protein
MNRDLERIGREAARNIPVKPGRHGVNRRSGEGTLAAYRGHQVGVHDAYKAIRKKYPEAAKYLLQQFRMYPNGDISLSGKA